MDYEIGESYNLWVAGPHGNIHQREFIFAGITPSTGSVIFMTNDTLTPQVLGKAVFETRENAVNWSLETAESYVLVNNRYLATVRENVEKTVVW